MTSDAAKVMEQVIDVLRYGHAETYEYAERLEKRGFSVTVTLTHEGSNIVHRIQASKAAALSADTTQHQDGWTGRKCPSCEGTGYGDDVNLSCRACAGTGEKPEHGRYTPSQDGVQESRTVGDQSVIGDPSSPSSTPQPPQGEDAPPTLKECPFCGASAQYYGFNAVSCTSCPTIVVNQESYSRSAEAWNRRAPVAEAPRVLRGHSLVSNTTLTIWRNGISEIPMWSEEDRKCVSAALVRDIDAVLDAAQALEPE